MVVSRASELRASSGDNAAQRPWPGLPEAQCTGPEDGCVPGAGPCSRRALLIATVIGEVAAVEVAEVIRLKFWADNH